MNRDHPPSLPGEHDDSVEAAIVPAGPDGIELVDLEQATGLRYRVLHNVTWRLEQQGRVPGVAASRPLCRQTAATSNVRGLAP
jgi:hypothetical protein